MDAATALTAASAFASADARQRNSAPRQAATLLTFNRLLATLLPLVQASRLGELVRHRFSPCIDSIARSSMSSLGTARFRHAASHLVKLDVIGKPVTLSDREAEELREAAAADAGRSSARRDLSLLLERGLRTKRTVALNRAEARELAELLTTGEFSSNLTLLQEVLLVALED